MTEGTPILELERAEPASADDSFPPVSLRLMQGEFVLIDARGSGRAKMLADLCCGILPLVQGQVRFLGRDWTKIPHLYAEAMRGRIGRVFARGGWIGFLDIATNIMLPQLHHTRRDPAVLREQASELARHFGLPGLPLGRPSELSGPDLARAACVRALLCEPVLLLLESPIQAQYGELVPAVMNAATSVRDRGGAVVWLTRSDLIWTDRSIPASQRLRLQDQGLIPVHRST